MSEECPYVSRGGLKLEHALRVFAIDVRGLHAADLGCSTGGFTDCLLRHGAARVVAIDTAYGQLAWTLRNDPRVVVRERSNALHAAPRSDDERVDLVVVDLGWTRQRLLLPAARAWLRSSAGRIVTLIKPHYEHTPEPAPRAPARRGRHTGSVLTTEQSESVRDRVLQEIRALGFDVLGVTPSPLLGGAVAGSKTTGTGNTEYLALLAPLGG